MDKSLFVQYVTQPAPTLPRVRVEDPNVASPLLKYAIDREQRGVRPPMGYGSLPLSNRFLNNILPLAANWEGELSSFFAEQGHHRLDWSTPLATIYELMRALPSNNAPSPDPGTLPPDQSLNDILSREQIDELLEIFALHYVPWLNFSFIRDSDGSVLEMVCCAIASRHAPPEGRTTLRARLRRLTEDTVAKLVLFNAQSTLEAVQALLVLALWSGDTKRDGRVLMASAVSIALNLRLNESSTKLLQLRATGSGTPEQIADMSNKARLWTALTNTESFLCFGTGRTPLAQRGQSDVEFIPIVKISPPETLSDCRDSRLRFLADMFNAVEAGSKIVLAGTSQEDVDKWYDANMKVLGVMDRLRRLIVPLEVLADYDRYYFHMLLVMLHFCRMLTLYHTLYEARAVFNRSSNRPLWFVEIKPHGMAAITTWGREMLQLGEAVLVGILQTDARQLSCCPDNLFCIVTLAANLAFAVKSLRMRSLGFNIMGSTDKLFRRTIQHFSVAAISEDHLAAGAARLLSAMLTKRDEFIRSCMASLFGPVYFPPAFPPAQAREESDVVGPPPEPPLDLPGMPNEIDPLTQDPEFWSQFLGYDPTMGVDVPFVNQMMDTHV